MLEQFYPSPDVETVNLRRFARQRVTGGLFGCPEEMVLPAFAAVTPYVDRD